MINSVENLITQVQGSNKKKNGTEAIAGGFEALLALLANQSLNVPGNISLDEKGKAAADIGGQSILSILGQGNSGGGLDEGIMALLGQGAGLSGIDGIQPEMGGIFDAAQSAGIAQSAGMRDVLNSLLSNSEPGLTQVQGNTGDNTSGTVMANVTSALNGQMPSAQTPGADAVLKDGLNIGPEQQQKGDKAISVPNFDYASKADGNITQAGGTKEGSPVDTQAAEKPQADSPDTVKANLEYVQSSPTDKQYIVNRPEILRMLKVDETQDTGKQQGNQDSKGQDAKDLQNSIRKGNTKEAVQNNQATADAVFDGSRNIFENTHQANISHSSSLQDGSNTGKVMGDLKDSILNQIFDKVKMVNGNNISELHVSLKPQELGEVAIKLVMEKGVMTGRILVENSYVKDLIQSNLSSIKENLKLQDLNVSGFSVSVGLNQSNQQNQQFNQNFSSNRWAQQRSSYPRIPSFEGLEVIQGSAQVGTPADRLNLLV